MYTKKQKVDFIYKNFTFKGGMTKKKLMAMPDESVDNFVSKYWKEFEQFMNQPKLVKFMVDGIQNGQELSWDAKGTDISEVTETFKNKGIKVIRIVPAKGHHRCMYCNGIAEGSKKDVLCNDCRETFGHYSFYEL